MPLAARLRAPDASPLVVPSAVQLGNEFTKLAKKLEPSVVYITADYTPKVAENPAPQKDEEQDPGDGNGNGDGLDLFKKFFRNGPSAATICRRAHSGRNSPAPASSSTRTATSSPTTT